MDFKRAATFGSYISKDYAEDLFRLLATYTSISASEAASRLNLHIKTVQDFMEAMNGLGILQREEVYEKKRPYFRYSLSVKRIVMEIDLEPLLPAENADLRTRLRIRERTRCATTLGFGPRFLHSTGQLHKGGPAESLFLTDCGSVTEIFASTPPD